MALHVISSSSLIFNKQCARVCFIFARVWIQIQKTCHCHPRSLHAGQRGCIRQWCIKRLLINTEYSFNHKSLIENASLPLSSDPSQYLLNVFEGIYTEHSGRKL